MSPFGPSFLPRPVVYFRNQRLRPSSAPRSANISHLRAIFLATRRSTLVYPERSRRATSHRPTPRFTRFHQLTNPSLPTIDLELSRYQQSTSPSFRNPFVFSSIQNPGGVWVQTFNFQLCGSASAPAPTQSGWQIPCSQQLAASLSSLCSLFHTPSLCFQ